MILGPYNEYLLCYNEICTNMHSHVKKKKVPFKVILLYLLIIKFYLVYDKLIFNLLK